METVLNIVEKSTGSIVCSGSSRKCARFMLGKKLSEYEVSLTILVGDIKNSIYKEMVSEFEDIENRIFDSIVDNALSLSTLYCHSIE